MKSKNSGLFVLVSGLGVLLCVAALAGFVLTIEHNNLPWAHGGESVRDHYTGVTDSYAQGFLVGFFLCLFLMMAAIALRSWVFQKIEANRRRRPRFDTTPVESDAPPSL
ncbi:MAG: hypothetical protein ACYTGG_14405 [Planctomycetota bacterium]